MGAAAPGPTLLVSASPADALDVEGDGADRAGEAARSFLDHHQLRGGAGIRVHRALPPHAGLGSGTQLALAVARALAELHRTPTDAAGLARATRRAQRSAIGTWTFAGGGFVLEGGRRTGSDEVAPLLARLPFPPSWRCIVAVPNTARGISGTAETAAFAQLPPPPERDVERVAHLVLMGLVPALAEADLATFGGALTAVQQITGRWFAPIQGGTFAPGPSEELVRRLAEWGASGVGQSSWGPAVYGIVDGEAAGLTLADRVAAALGGEGTVHEGPFRTEGARVWRGDDSASFQPHFTV
jgi:beta-RFAP synthase